MRKQGMDIGVFPIEELQRRRAAGEFTGAEYIQREGTTDWQPLDLVLQKGYQLAPPHLPRPVSQQGPNQTVVWFAIGTGIVFCLLFVMAFVYGINKIQRNTLFDVNQRRSFSQPNPGSIAIAGRPIVWTNTTQTAADSQKRARDFGTRQWIDGYEKRSQHNPEFDAEADQFIRAYVSLNPGFHATNFNSLEGQSDKLANDTNCRDPLILTITADQSLNLFEAIHRFERALAAYPDSQYKAYPELYATVRLAAQLDNNPVRVSALDSSAVTLLKQCFADGSFTPADQEQIGEIFINGWGYDFFQRNEVSVCNVVHAAGPDYKWLALVLDGEHEIDAAWDARGDGYGDSVTDEGWRGFHSHLATASSDFTAAWELHPDWPLAPERMITVSLGQSDIAVMRQWFDRTTLAQIDYPRAWSDFLWGLYPRWYGNHQAMLALGVAAVNTRRFDTDVPYKYMQSIQDVESDSGLSPGEHIYGRHDVWPNLQRMYEGYVDAASPAPSQKQQLEKWRTRYAITAYLAGKYDVAHTQLEALDWKVSPENVKGLNIELALMPLEVAARASSLSNKISAAESARNAGDASYALKKYNQMKDAPGLDGHAASFIKHRISELSAENSLEQGKWINLLPLQDNDPDWVYEFGQAHVLPDGALEVESGTKGHMLFSRVRAGMNFEIRGQFEVIRSSNKNFQGGLVMGVPDFDGYEWYGFRIKRHDEEGDLVSFSDGWSRDQIVQHLTLNDVTNSFDFTFQDGKVTAIVNGTKVFNNAEPPVNIRVPNNSYLVGLGAFNDSADTVIRYRNIQLRKL
ncbi:MAG TPA: hypothetical protein VMH87_12555 [Pseudomonadales bacterium]|nr:hypothetical protein [Pseudomonadales bacterium]